ATRRRCCAPARCWWREATTIVTVALAGRRYMIRLLESGRRPAACLCHALVTRRRCCFPARCWRRGGGSTVGRLERGRGDARRPGCGPRPAILVPHAGVTRRRCCA